MPIDNTLGVPTSTAGGLAGGLAGGNTIAIDYNHPLFLHASDGPGSLPVGIQLVGMKNYMLWNRAMRIALLGRNKLGLVDGTIMRETYGSELAYLWDRCNAIVVSWLTSNISRDLLSGILFRSNAHLVWKELKERFNKINGSRRYALHKEIFTLSQGTQSVSMYYSRLKDLWDEYDSMIPPPTCNCEKYKDYLAQLHYQRL
ncbi:uncharacterized protein LOC107839809 [Capsicum annuum]|uniref:uncharacterized protein LOC107839809 n=1 Tax=Capsicum annuum TaxID=4072 RepID=UPI0007BFADF2|nr:uncharacterized protein LOC107839809 [Capsicum annuum]